MTLVQGRGLRLTLLVIAVFLLFLAVDTPFAEDHRKGSHEELSCHTGPYAIDLPQTLTELRSIGKLRNERILEAGEVGDYKAELRKLVFDGLNVVVSIQADASYTSFLFSQVTITSPKWKIANGFRVGDTADSVKKRLRGNVRVEKNWLEIFSDCDSLRFLISNGKVKKIIYQCYTG